ncbi:tyrosine-type recombinase/integrase [Methylobacterium sp. C25]|uniref:tyrosine-type recombinase/integrase n=1 Tax=Methylobacterium sp. C25 TaxID=2721622 RepID=UPI001F40AD46|nr:tyrosine-type recombinase/integrase [Methylobacterium sp. C25]MCE4225913.1 tyrosine-type recombinase/integrase [Methylobacterium sp. C25]
MSRWLLDTGLIRVSVRYVKPLKPGGPLFYVRRIPKAVQQHYGGKALFRQSLGTRDLNAGTRKAAKLAREHDALWSSLGSKEGQRASLTTPENREAARALLASLGLSPGDLAPGVNNPEGYNPDEIIDDFLIKQHGPDYEVARYEPIRSPKSMQSFWSPIEAEAVRLLKEDQSKPSTLLSDALRVYLEDHDKGSHPKFETDTKRAIGHVLSAVGDLPLNQYNRENAKLVRNNLLKGNKTGTARRRLNTIKAVFNKGLLEFNQRHLGNPFERIQIAGETQDAVERGSFTASERKVITKACRALNDDIRHIVALQADTGARLGEIVGLRLDDVVLDHETPHILIRPLSAAGRTLKTANSEREVPLVGEALWAATEALKAVQGNPEKGPWLFPRYASDNQINANSASAVINKWLKKTLKIDKTSHSFRHTMRDRLRHAGVPQEFQDLIGGWGKRSVAQSYGEGYLLKQLHEQLDKIS